VFPIKENRKLPLILLAFSYIASIVYSYFLSFTERGIPLFDWFNIAVQLVWLAIVAWVAWGIYTSKPNAKRTVLFFAGLIGLLTVFDLLAEDTTLLLTCISAIQALLIFAAYMSMPNIGESEYRKE